MSIINDSASDNLFSRKKKPNKETKTKTPVVEKVEKTESTKITKTYSLHKDIVKLINEIREHQGFKGDNSAVVSEAIIYYCKNMNK